MAVFEYQIQKNGNRTDAKSGEKLFYEWCESNGLGLEGFSAVSASDKVWKGRPVTFYVASYGYYQVEGGWVVYIAYRGDILNHIRNHSWRWDGKKADLSTYSFNEFVNI